MNKRKILIIGSLVLLVLLGIGMFIFKEKTVTNITQPISTDFNRLQPTITPTLIPYPVLGSMTVQTKVGLKRLPNNKEFVLVVDASSEGKNIVGYDIILSFDKSAFTYVRTISSMPDFNVFSYERPTYISLSAIKSLQNNKIVSWNNQPLVEMVFVPKKTGTFVFTLSPEGKETSKLVDDTAQVVYPKTDKLELEIY